MGVRDWWTTKRNFAEGTGLTPTNAGRMSEIGVSGDSMIGFEGTEARTDNLSVGDYIKMRQKDGTVSSLYNILTLPIVGNTWHIDADEADSNEEQANLVRKNLLEPPHKGGMQIPLSLTIADMLRATLEGFRLFEKVYMIQDGKIVYKKLASRDSRTITLIRGDDGLYGGAVQLASFKGEYINVTIAAEKTFLFTYGKDKNFLYGESAFKAAYYHYDKKHRYYYLQQLAIQRGAVPPGVATASQGTSDPDRDKFLKEVKKFGNSTAYLWKPDSITFEPYDTAKGFIDPQVAIDHQNTEMARSILAQFLMLGTSGQKTVGSWALSQSHEDIFITALKGLMNNIQDHINYYLIPDLVDLNFPNAAYPEFKFDDMTDDSQTIISEAFQALISAKLISPEMAKGLEQQVANKLDIDLEAIEDDLEAEVEEEGTESIEPDPNPPKEPPVAPAAPAAKPAAPVEKKKLSDQQWFRPLTPAERQVNFAQIQSTYNTLERQFEADLKPVFDKIKTDAIDRLKPLLEAGSISSLDGFSLRYAAEYQAVIAKTMKDAYNYAKTGAADELHIPAPATNRDSSTFISQNAGAVAAKQLGDLLFALKAAVLKELRKNKLSERQLGLTDVLAAVSVAFSAFFDTKVSVLGGVLVAQGINRGRMDVFESDRANAYAYQYSAILDEKTCPICESLDGSVVDYAGWLDSDWEPPIHMNCRCLWVEISKDELDPPEITGLPDSPGGADEPQL